MAPQQRRRRPITIQELLDPQREPVPARCTHCGRDAADRDHELVQAALRARIRALETRLYELEAEHAGTAAPAPRDGDADGRPRALAGGRR